MSALRIRRLRLFPLSIPMRLRFEHAAAQRDVADPVILRIDAEAPFSDDSGHGETLARPYVSGETVETVLADVPAIFVPLLLDLRAESFAEVVEFADALPYEHQGRCLNAARALVELALLDLAGRVFGRRAAEAVGWMDLGFCPPGCLEQARYSGIVVGRKPAKLRWFLWLQKLYGLRDFKIKVATDGWEQKLDHAARVLAPLLRSKRCTLRADANAGWSLAQALAALPKLQQAGVSALEQPLPKTADDDLPALAAKTRLDLIADESLVSRADAERLLEQRAVKVFNIRIAKNGGLLPALRMAKSVLHAGRDVQLGCLVGETSLLTAAGAAFLEACPRVRFVEGAFGSRLLRSDITASPLRFGYGGRLRAPPGSGLGVDVDSTRLQRLATRSLPPMNL